MVESIGLKPVTGERSVARVAPVVPAPAVASAVPVQPSVQPSVQAPVRAPAQLSGVAQQLAANAPVDMERVAAIKRAIADGSFPILPSTIADRLLALRLEWAPNGEA